MKYIKKIHHLGIVVKDIDKSKEFYNDLGFKKVSDYITSGEDIDYAMGTNNLKIHAIFMEFSGCMLELMQMEPNHNKEREKSYINDIGIRHIAFEVKELNKLYENLTAKSIKFISSPRVLKNQQNDILAYCYDPDGNIIEFYEKK